MVWYCLLYFVVESNKNFLKDKKYLVLRIRLLNYILIWIFFIFEKLLVYFFNLLIISGILVKICYRREIVVSYFCDLI